MKKRIIALILCLALALSVFTGCSGSKTADSGAAESGADSGAVTLTVPQEARDDLVKYLTDGALAADTVLVTVSDGERSADISTEYYLYWLGYYYSQMSSYYNYYGQPMDLAEEVEEGKTMADALKEMADQAVVTYSAMGMEAAAHGVEPSEEDLNQVEEYAAAQEENYCLYNAATQEAIRLANIDFVLYSDFGELLYAEGGEFQLSDEDVQNHIKENGVYNCRYILCQVEEDADEETANAAKETCEGYYEELSKLSGDELLDRFKELQANNPDGNLEEFSFDATSSLTEGFRETLEKMEIGEVAMSDKTGYGYFVILRLEPDTESLMSELQASDYAKQLSIMTDAYEGTNSADYEKLDAMAILTKLQGLQEAIVSEETAAAEAEAETSAEGDASAEASSSAN